MYIYNEGAGQLFLCRYPGLGLEIRSAYDTAKPRVISGTNSECVHCSSTPRHSTAYSSSRYLVIIGPTKAENRFDSRIINHRYRKDVLGVGEEMDK